jgi:C4-dicarboxylate transporter DctQ subunit
MRSTSRLMRSGYEKSIVLVNKLEGAILIISVLIMGCNNVSNVIGRVVFNQSLYFTDELNSILIIFITFAGTSYAARLGSHIRMTAIFDVLPSLYQKVLITLIAFITSICIFAICYFSVEYISWIAPKGKVLPAMQIPVYLTYIWVPVSLFLTGLEYFATGIKNIFSKDMHLSSQITGDGYDNINEL